MRRIASFVARHVDHPDAPSTSSADTDSLPQAAAKRKARMFNSLSRKLAPPSRPPLLASDHSSSSASSASAELRTPDDEVLPRTPNQRGSWKSWLGAKKHRTEGDLKAAARLPQFPTPAIALRPPPRFNDTDDTSSELEDELPVQNFVPSTTLTRNNMRAIILNSSVERPSCPPLLDIPGGSPFPRSCLLSRHIHRRDTLESKMHKTALLRLLESLTPTDERSIAPLGARPVILVKEAPAHNSDIDVWPKAQLFRRISGGLGNWVARPCFEDRVLVWTRQEPSGQVVTSDVAGSQFGVAALEFSEPLYILAGLLADVDDDFDPNAEHPEPSPPDPGVAAVALSSREQLTTPVAVADFEFSPLTLPVGSPETSESTKETTSPKQAEPTAAPRVKREVRFAEDGKDDQIPLGYVLRIKKRREEKARFLREEREKRELEEEKSIREEERRSRLREAEKRAQEKEQNARELQKKKTEEERRRQSYSVDLQASRARSEASRAGHISSSSSLVRDIERDRSVSRDARPSGSPSTRQRTLDLTVPTANLSPYDGSPASSMPATPQGSQRSFSRPPSVYSGHTASSEDVRARDGRRISRHSTLAIDPSKHLPLPLQDPRASLVPYNYNPWTNMQMPPVVIPSVPLVPVAPMMTPMPYYPMDIPLLPPSPPFMMNQFGNRQRPTNFLQGQVSSPRYNSSSNHSADDRVHHTSRAAPNSPGLSSAHQRRASDEVRGNLSSANVMADRKYGSQTDLAHKRPSQAVHSSRGSGLHHSHQPPALVHSHTSPALAHSRTSMHSHNPPALVHSHTSPVLAHSRTSMHSHISPALAHSHTSTTRPVSTSQPRPASNRRQTLYS
ncbi:hypothetical protein K503DRAFT_764973 [Rhizopogon vinicolor AM-OR11-026]|uniref:Uncharacterized protein n=1 Tax=Rhizopogon vinicolor AM-OR11-026 TaxID=1314800 RepID=A0A1B7NIH1_9AGAM|nr:hypothetical protein K503DRAFT_764973 [Rhizopogon vinicolor AM-OR11-026]